MNGLKNQHLVGGPWKIWVRQLGWWHSQYIESQKSHVPKHQPVDWRWTKHRDASWWWIFSSAFLLKWPNRVKPIAGAIHKAWFQPIPCLQNSILFDLDDVGSQSHDVSIHFLFLWLFYVGGKFNFCIAPTDWPLLLFICIFGYPNSSEPLPSKKPLDRWWLKCLKWFFKISQSRVFFMVSLSFSFSDYLFDLRLLKLAVCSSLFYSFESQSWLL